MSLVLVLSMVVRQTLSQELEHSTCVLWSWVCKFVRLRAVTAPHRRGSSALVQTQEIAAYT